MIYLIIIVVLLFSCFVVLLLLRVFNWIKKIKTSKESKSLNEFKFKDWNDIDLNTWGYIISSKFNKNNSRLKLDFEHGHGLIIGGSGSGKSQKIIIPFIKVNSLSKDKPSFIVNDIKGEIFDHTVSLLKEQGYKIISLVFEEGIDEGFYNPLYLIYKNKNNENDLYRELEIVSNFTFNYEKEKDPFWMKKAQEILKGIIYWMIENDIEEEKFNFQTVKHVFERLSILKTDIKSKNGKSYFYLSDFLSYEKSKTIETIFICFQTEINRYIEGIVGKISSTNNIRFEDLIEVPTIIYLKNPFTNLNINNFLALFIFQLNNYLINREEINLKRDVINVLDEFSSFVKIKQFDNWLAITRQKRIWYLIAIQNIAQFNQIYENINLFSSNFKYEYFLGSGDKEIYNYFIKDWKLENSESFNKWDELISFNKFNTLNNDEVVIKIKNKIPKIEHLDIVVNMEKNQD